VASNIFVLNVYLFAVLCCVSAFSVMCLFFYFSLVLWPGEVGGSVKEGRIVCTIETQ
jgi:hypothetical protein